MRQQPDHSGRPQTPSSRCIQLASAVTPIGNGGTRLATTIAGIEFFGHVGWFDGQRAGLPCRNLLFARASGAGDGLLDFRGAYSETGMSRDKAAPAHPLRPAQLEHGLHVFAKKRRLHRQMIRSVRLNQRGAPVKNPLQLDRMVLVLGKVQRTHFHQFHLFAADPITPYPMMVVPGSMPKMICSGAVLEGLEGMLRRRYIWKCVFATSSPRRPWATSPGH